MSQRKVIDNLKTKIDSLKQQYENSYARYFSTIMYNKAIQQVVDEKLGVETSYLDTSGIVSISEQ